MLKNADAVSSSIERGGFILTENLSIAIDLLIESELDAEGLFDTFDEDSCVDSSIVKDVVDYSQGTVDFFLKQVTRTPELSQDFPNYSPDIIYAIFEMLNKAVDIRHLAPLILLMKDNGICDEDIVYAVTDDEYLTDQYYRIAPIAPSVVDIASHSYSEKLVKEILSLLSSSGTAFDSYDFYLLIKNWDKFKDYPVEWSLSVLQTEPVGEVSDADNYDDYDEDEDLYNSLY